MRTLNKLLLLALVFWGLAPAGSAQAPGSCVLGTAQRDLDINNVQARVFNTGSLFFGSTSEAVYLVPKNSGNSAIFASGIWIGGKVGGDVRVAGSTYSNFEFWPGPLGDDGNPVNPADCSAYDQIYKVSREDIQTYEGTGTASADLANWPYELGAPVIDGDGNPDNYDLAAGDRPDIIGDQALWWVMNDVGNTHRNTGSQPIGIEVRVQAFAFNRADALGNTTFYKYTVVYKGTQPLTEAYLSVFSDPDLGDAADDYVGSDVDLSLGYVYNGDNDDAVYGTPPAVGYDFFQGPIVDGDTLGLTGFSYFENASTGPTTDPDDATEIYRYMQGLWKDGSEMVTGGNGYPPQSAPGGEPTRFAFTGDPATGEFWSEVNVDGNGGANPAGDRRFVVTTGPFTIQPGDQQDIVFGIVYGLGTDNLSSVDALRAADILAQNAYDVDFQLPSPPPAPPACNANSPNPDLQPGSGSCLEAVELDGEAAIVWGYPSNSPNYLGSFEEDDPFLADADVDDKSYNFEGFNVYRYPTADFSADSRQLVATYDIVNGVTTVRDLRFDSALGDFLEYNSAQGSDSGLQWRHLLANLTNATDYYYGVSAYAYSPNSTPRILESSPTQVTIRPSDISVASGGTRLQADFDDETDIEIVNQNGQGSVSATVVDPSQVTGDSYRVVFYEGTTGEGETVTLYDIINANTGRKIIDGAAYLERFGQAPPQEENVVVGEGLSFTVVGPPKEAVEIYEFLGGAQRSVWCSVSLSPDPAYIVGGYGNTPCSGSLLGTIDWRGLLAAGAPLEYEIRYVENPEDGQLVFNRTWDGVDPAGAFMTGWVTADSAAVGEEGEIILYGEQTNTAGTAEAPRLPFTFWEIQPDGSETQVHALIIDDNGNGLYDPSQGALDGGYAGGYSATPYERIYISNIPYDEAATLADPVTPYDATFPEVIGRFMILPYATRAEAGGALTARPPKVGLPAPGAAIRFTTTKPNLPGDEFVISTDSLGVVRGDLETAQEALDQIAVVPNPYRGGSAYETGNLDRRVRFTNLPDQVTIRIYTVAGTLIRTLTKDGMSRSLDWDLTTENNLPVASGMYLIHVEARTADGAEIGERVLKFGVINRQLEVNVF